MRVIDGDVHLFYDATSGSALVSWAKALKADFIDLLVADEDGPCILVVPQEMALAGRIPGRNFRIRTATSPDAADSSRPRTGSGLWRYKNRWRPRLSEAA
jgi:hypothetical protein